MDNILEFLIYLNGPLPYIVAFGLLLACGLGLPMPEDITLFALGILSYYGLVDLFTSMLVCFFGVMAGDILVYYFGYHYGHKITQHPIIAKFLHTERLGKTQELFHKWGNKLIFGARFMPGLRAPTFFSAGTLKLPFYTFLIYDGLAALLSVPLFMYIAYYFGDQVDYVIHFVRKIENGIVFLVLGVVLIFILKHFLLNKKKHTQNS